MPLVANRFDETADRLVDRFVRRMLVESAIADAIDSFHMDMPPSAGPAKINVELHPTQFSWSRPR